MAVYPLRTALGAMIHFLIALTVVLILVWSFKGFANLAVLPALFVGVAILLVFGWAVALLAGYINTIFRDVQHLSEIGFQILFYLTPIMYPPDVLTRARMGWLLRYNPLHPFLKIIREPLVEGRLPPVRNYWAAAAMTIMVTTVASLILGRLQRRVILYL
jgi:ABC-type polysaccharide/polyol phosphate export permease